MTTPGHYVCDLCPKIGGCPGGCQFKDQGAIPFETKAVAGRHKPNGGKRIALQDGPAAGRELVIDEACSCIEITVYFGNLSKLATYRPTGSERWDYVEIWRLAGLNIP